ncbi:MAG: protein kinase domain-containing protein, partial [Gemmatimonadales bacterium]
MPDLLCPACRSPLAHEAAFCSRCGAQSPTVISIASPVSPFAPPPTPLPSPAPGPAATNPPQEASVMERLGTALGPKYEVRRLLGHGGFAEVFEVFDKDLMRRLAVKVLKPDIAWSSGMLERFKQEARAIARLSHPNILPIHFVGDGEGLVYYAMPFIEGESLGHLLRSSDALAPDRALGIAKPILEALAHAHQNGLVHRDIKPDNVMIESGSGRVLLVDFGIAKQVDGSAKMTQTGFVVGTPQYMSPEQALGQGDIDARTDIYAMGAMLYQMVTGVAPFEGDTSQEIIGKHLSEPVPVPSSRNAKIPKWLSDVIVRCLAKRAGERFQSAVMVLEALHEGRRSGSQQGISAERVAQRIQADDATALLPSAERPAATPPGPALQRPTSLGYVHFLAAGGAVAAVALYFVLFAQPTLILENRLVEPIRVAWNGETLSVAPGSRLVRRVPRGRQLVLQWALVRPVSDAGKELGSDMQGSIVEDRPRGKLHKVIDSRSAGAPYFAPLITNVSSRALGVLINAGLAGAVDCYCPVASGSVREHVGYYPLFLNSSVGTYTT